MARNGKVLVSDQLERGRHGATRLEQAVNRMRQGLPLDGDDRLLLDCGPSREDKAVIAIIEAAAHHRLVAPLPEHLQPALRLQPIAVMSFGGGARLGEDAIIEALTAQMAGSSTIQ